MLARHCLLLLCVGLCSAEIGSHPAGFFRNWFSEEIDTIGIDQLINCEEGMYYSRESGECEYCSECDQAGMYIRSACSLTKNTQCGWCASRQIVKNDDFERKCENYLTKDENQIEIDDEIEEKPVQIQNGKIVEIINDDAESIFKVKEKPSKYDHIIKTIKNFADRLGIKESASTEIDTEIAAREVDESDIGKSEETQTDIEDIIADRKSLSFVDSVYVMRKPDDDLPPLPVDDLSDEDLEEDEETEKKAYVWKDELKTKIEMDMLKKQRIEAELQKGETSEDEDLEDESVLEVKPPKSSESLDLDGVEAQELIRPAKEILPLKIVVTGDADILKDMPPVADGDSSSSESKEDSSSDEDDEFAEVEVSQENVNDRASKRMIRFCIMAITFVVMCWVYVSYREKRRRRVFIFPPLDNFSPEQQHMINRCNCKFEKLEGGHCYENKLAYV